MKFKFLYIFAVACFMQVNSAFGISDGKKVLADTLPADFPKATFSINDANKADKGSILWATQQNNPNYLIIMDNEGKTVKWKKSGLYTFNFQLLPNGLFSYSESVAGIPTQAITRILDTNLNLVKSYQCGNGYLQFPSDFKMLPNGHVLMTMLEPLPINMRDKVAKGDPNAQVIGNAVQELDENGKVVFQWRSFDHIPIEDCYEDQTSPSFRYVHLNGIDLDQDGNYLVSCRHLAQIVKIDRNTGEVIWRLGGKKSDFSFINEHEENAPLYFNHQHDIRKLQNGNITFFDNGNIRKPVQYSRALEYKLDEKAKTADLVWDYRQEGTVYASTSGSVQLLKNGNYMVGWGQASQTGSIAGTEITPSGEVVMAYSIPKGLIAYRAYKVHLPACEPVAKVTKEELLQLNTYNFDKTNDTTGISITFSKLVTPIPYNSFTVTKYECSPQNPVFEADAPLLLNNRVTFEKTVIDPFEGEVTLKLASYSRNIILDKPAAFFRTTIDSGVFKALPTTFDKSANTITFKIFSAGELVIGSIIDTVAPAMTRLIQPYDSTTVNKQKQIKFNWSPNGRYTSSKFELFKRVSGVDTRIYTLDTTSTSLLYQIPASVNGEEYTWRVTSSNKYGAGAPSSKNLIVVSDPFMQMLSPNGSEVFNKDSVKYIIKWQDNLDDLVKIELLKSDTLSLLIADSLSSPLNVIQWLIPKKVVEGSDYKIRVTNVKDKSLICISENQFSIKDVISVTEVDKDSSLAINIYPNPFTQSTQFDVTISVAGTMTLKIYDLLGNDVASIVDTYATPGKYSYVWTPENLSIGTYNYVLKSGNGKLTGNLIKAK